MDDYLSDRKLARRLLAGEEAAFHEFFDGHFRRLYRFVIVRADGDEDAAKEICQRTLSRAVRKMHTYRGEAALFTWLCRICRSEASDFFAQRRRDREHVVLFEDDPFIRGVLETMEAPEENSPQGMYGRAELARLVQMTLDHLPARYGDALEWKYVQGLSVQEIAERMQIGVTAAQSVLARARRAFKENFETLFGISSSEFLDRHLPDGST